MSGIAGIHEAEKGASVDRATLDGMIAAIAHRGPDGTGVHVGQGVGLAACRLAVIDPEGGKQPFSSEDDTVHVILDGAIANFRSLRDQLESLGHVFRTGSDTEVLLNAYRQWGADCVYRLRGIFAFAIWSSAGRELFLARDHSGAKPLYLSIRPTRTLFASEAKALLTIPELRVGIDLVGYLGGIDFDAHLRKSPFLGILELSPGCTLRCTDSKRATSRYWSWEPSRETGRLNPMNVAADFAASLHEAVGLQLEADVPVALSLSGGVDSAVVAASMVLHGRRDIVSYTFESENDETRDGLASQVTAQFLKIENRKVTRALTSVTDEDLSRLAWQSEGEFTLGFLERLEIAKAARDAGAKVLVTGQGIDEVLTGNYSSYDVFRNLALVRHLRGEIEPSPRGWPRFSPEVLGAVGADLSGWMGRDGEAWWAERAATTLHREHARLSSGLLRFEDRMCAAAQVEARVPLLDHELLGFCGSIPEGSRAELFTGKTLLRSVAMKFLPRNIAGRPRTVSSAWQRPMSAGVMENRGALARLLDEEAVNARGWFSWQDVEAMRRGGDWVSLDHVLILHLMDEIFIRDFRLAR
jgi:asparagine synthase (glutamine-hydrolysing)